ncbi:MAG TPA: hypothetical protein V6D19_07165 [Stenomitos sp.]
MEQRFREAQSTQLLLNLSPSSESDITSNAREAESFAAGGKYLAARITFQVMWSAIAAWILSIGTA